MSAKQNPQSALHANYFGDLSVNKTSEFSIDVHRARGPRRQVSLDGVARCGQALRADSAGCGAELLRRRQESSGAARVAHALFDGPQGRLKHVTEHHKDFAHDAFGAGRVQLANCAESCDVKDVPEFGLGPSAVEAVTHRAR
jgi:hypothetical protein